MPEAEELIVDAARHATVAAQGIWRRWRDERSNPPSRWHLDDYKQRLALLIEAVLGMQLPVRVAQAPTPVSWLERLRRRAVAPAKALPSNDGNAVYLPPHIDIVVDTRGESNRNDYPVLTLLQAIRCVRGSAGCYGLCDTALAADLYLLAEAAAADRALLALLPGWRAPLDALYARNAASLARVRPDDTAGREVLALYRTLLDRSDALPLARTPQDSAAWANRTAHLLGPAQRYRQWLADPVIGRLLKPEAAPIMRAQAGTQAAAGKGRQATLARRPRISAGDEEDDASPGPWMIQTSEPHEHAEDPQGLNRPLDRDVDSDIEGDAQSLAELESARLVSTPGRSAQTLYSTDAPPRLERDGDIAAGNGSFVYPEWDYRATAYRSHARVHASSAEQGAQAWVDAALARHAATLREIRRRLGAIRPVRHMLRRQTEGDDIDCDALVDERSEARAGATPAGAVYQQQQSAPRRIGLLLLIDASASTDAWIAGGQRVIDVEKEAALVAACALDMSRADFSVLTFSGEGAQGIQVRSIKDFDQPWNDGAMRRIAGIEPDRCTRLGGAVRHACMLLARRTVDFRLLLLFSDGKPNDCDRYAGKYGLEDARQALIEARLQQIEPYCFTVDREGSGYLPHLFGAGQYTVVQRSQQLPLAFVDWLRKAALRASSR
ncbi:hypothetical protein EGT07_11385 [Herbaspirillum sp. HC18]|nr:hypothetical protein EGT07_11385 [Herbaspirillum sp. HC18]